MTEPTTLSKNLAGDASKVRIPFIEHLGIKVVEATSARAVITLDKRPELLNSLGAMHGGVLMTMLDVVMAHAARSVHSHDPGSGPGVATIEMKTSFMRPAEGQLRALGQLLHRTTTMAFCEGRVLDDRGELCAHATATFKYLRALPTRGRTLKDLQRNPETS